MPLRFNFTLSRLLGNDLHGILVEDGISIDEFARRVAMEMRFSLINEILKDTNQMSFLKVAGIIQVWDKGMIPEMLAAMDKIGGDKDKIMTNNYLSQLTVQALENMGGWVKYFNNHPNHPDLEKYIREVLDNI